LKRQQQVVAVVADGRFPLDGKAAIFELLTMSRSQLKVEPVAGIIMQPFSVEQERAASHG
jgi:hypothetical protein